MTSPIFRWASTDFGSFLRGGYVCRCLAHFWCLLSLAGMSWTITASALLVNFIGSWRLAHWHVAALFWHVGLSLRHARIHVKLLCLDAADAYAGYLLRIGGHWDCLWCLTRSIFRVLSVRILFTFRITKLSYKWTFHWEILCYRLLSACTYFILAIWQPSLTVVK